MQSNYLNRILNFKKDRLKIILCNNSDTFSLKYSNSDTRVRNQSELEFLIRKKNSLENKPRPKLHMQTIKPHIKQILPKEIFNTPKETFRPSNDSFHNNSIKKNPVNKKLTAQDWEKNYNAKIQSRLIKEEDRIKFLTQNVKTVTNGDVNEKKELFKKNLISSEKDYLKSASFNTRLSTLDATGFEMLKGFPSLNRSSADPRHLTILHSSVAGKVANMIYERDFNNTTNSTFIDILPGASLVTEKLLQKQTNSKRKFILLESDKMFIRRQMEIKSKYETKDTEIHLVRGKPFEGNFLYKNTETRRNLIQLIQSNSDETKSKLTIFNILPWNSKGYLQRLVGDFYLNRGFFRLGIESNLDPEFYFFLPELLVAKLKPNNSNKNYNGFKGALTIHTSLFCDCEIIDEQSAEYFFPYPQVTNPYRYNAHPYDKLDCKKLFLVNLKFKAAYLNNQTEVLNTNFDKKLFYFFVLQFFARPTARVKEVLKSFCKDIENVCKINGINQYFMVKQLTPHHFYYLFKYFNDNPDVLHLKSLENALNQNEGSQADSRSTRIDKQLKALKQSNQNLTGQFIIPSYPSDKDTVNNAVNNENLNEKNDFDSKFVYDELDDDQSDNQDEDQYNDKFDDDNYDDEPDFYEKKSSVVIK